jgi:hypothetical protein
MTSSSDVLAQTSAGPSGALSEGHAGRPGTPGSAAASPAGAAAIRLQLIDECDAMARHALGEGMALPAWIAEVVESSRVENRGVESSDSALSLSDPYESGEWDVAALMAPSAIGLSELVRAHAALARIIFPATPRGILLLSRGRRYGRLRALGPVRLIRQMLVVVIVMLAAFIAIATSPHIHSTSGDIFRSSGLPLLLNELFYIAAGGLGAAFYALFTAYRYIAAGNYDTTYESSYWIRFILGLIAGVLMAALIPIGKGNATRPLLALLGGFSAAMLYRILERLVETVESLVVGDAKPREMARQDAASARALVQSDQDRLALVGDLIHLRDALSASHSSADLVSTVDKVLAEVVYRGLDRNGAERARPPDESSAGR